MTQALPLYSNARFIAIRLLPGDDVLLTLRKQIALHGFQAAFIAGCVGSLTNVALRFAGQEDADHIRGKFEIVSLIGTLEANGEHLHLSVSDEKGHMRGGHMMPGCSVRTTLELVIGELENIAFTREPCSLSSYEELVVISR
ncbi:MULTISPECIES: PPC domain-containing DNA-binding protein [unclassified Providencia]|uniref:PPC domain-containing DNA-binding protein n=1 Tax=unclassified Providencia TaxID=2633465 RepID=UPI00234B6DE6|nr:PPC domain-containing DNA-binding protein [Providencia sp. PROV197]